MSAKTLPPEMPKLGRRPDQEGNNNGFLASLLAKLGLGGGGATGAYPAATVAGNPLWAGILASKAGVTALVLAGVATAGGMSAVIYKNFGPVLSGDDAPADAPGLEFRSQQRPSDAAASQPTANPKGVSDSLVNFQRANPGQGQFAASAPAAGQTTTAAVASSAGQPGVPNNANGPSQAGVVSRPAMVAGQGFDNNATSSARLSTPGGLSGGIGNGFQQIFHPSAARSASLASASGSGSATGAGSRALVGGVGSKAMQQLGATNSFAGRATQSVGLGSSNIAGTTFDGRSASMASTNAGGANAGGLGLTGGGITAANAAAKANPATPPNQVPPVPPVGPSGNATPWQWAVNVAMGAMALALIAFMALHVFKEQRKESLESGNLAAANGWLLAARIAAGIATMAALVTMAMGLTILNSYGQTIQGWIWTAVGGLFTLIAAHSLYDLVENAHSATDKQIADEDQAKQAAANKAGDVAKAGNLSSDLDPKAYIKNELESANQASSGGMFSWLFGGGK